MPIPDIDLARWWPAWLPSQTRVRLEAAYDGPWRGYHDRRHLVEVLQHVDELISEDEEVYEVVQLAAWFHDAVYDGTPDDERKSAELATEELTAAGAPAVLAHDVARLVLLTAAHRPDAGDRAGEVLCDADLAILAAEPERYRSYVEGVRREYSHVSEPDFAAGRAGVLRGLLAKPTLFHTPVARDRWESAARANLRAEIAALRADSTP